MKINTIQSEVRVLEGDQHTPISLYLKLKGKKKFLLESSLKHEKTGRYSFIGVDPYYEFLAWGNKIERINLQTKEVEKETGDVMGILNTLVREDLTLPMEIPFTCGGVGYLGYDVVKMFETIGGDEEDELEMPDIHLMFYEKLIVYDHLLQKIYCIAIDRWITGEEVNRKKLLDDLEQEITKGIVEFEEDFTLSHFQSRTAKSSFEQKVKEAKEYINEGEIFQVVLSQRLHADFTGQPFQYYRKLRRSNPSPYMFFLDFENYIVLGTSPESLIKVTDRTVTTNPIAGTRRRGHSDEEDKKLEEEMLLDEKEVAEHQMLVDLGRNDLGRVCKPGSIKLSKYMMVERYKYVMHIVSEVTGTLKGHETSLSALKACLPAGTVSGAPKIRAMQIISELENLKRGVYSGAVGYISANGNLDFALAIRTMILKDTKAYVQAGAGVVYDSIPAGEYEETLNKAKALLEVK
ncbi:anthranilate synthase component 1 [Bacillus pakistanensis]|uniref:Anthranilate synthase component 1 n=1 Tax=Rossellomorea pakistanensis TaxID=992288 RepID=A0ABS2N8M4_9BACI|nr:anthranilate synthase component 1 [Bacillus pakistanensis]